MLVFFNKVSMFCYNISEPVYIWMFLGALPNSLKRVLWAKLRSHVFHNSKKNVLQKEVIHTYLSNWALEYVLKENNVSVVLL